MKNKILLPKLFFIKDVLTGQDITKSSRKLKDLKGIFKDQEAFDTMDKETLVYDVSSHLPVKEGTPGGLYFGVTYIHPGKVGNEYFMTKGHFHAQIDRAEYYWGIQGEGILILMDEDRNVWGEKMLPGSLHYIPGRIAHRVANVSNQILSFGACWPSDAGYDYEEIAENGIAKRLLEIDGKPNFI